MEEVIAVKQRYFSKRSAIFMIVFGAIVICLLSLALILYPVVLWRFTFLDYIEAWKKKFFIVFGFIFGVTLLVVGIITLCLAGNAPKVIIKYRDGMLYFDGGFSCRIEEIESVRCNTGRYPRNDTLTVVVNGREMNFKMIEDVQRANDRLIELMMESRDRASVWRDY